MPIWGQGARCPLKMWFISLSTGVTEYTEKVFLSPQGPSALGKSRRWGKSEVGTAPFFKSVCAFLNFKTGSTLGRQRQEEGPAPPGRLSV